ncbi:carbohydrate ABC transporter permease [soil metagenome]
MTGRTIRRRVRWRPRTVLGIIALGIVAVWSLMPIYFVFTSALKAPIDIFAWPPQLIPTNPSFDNFVDLFATRPEFADGLRNSLVIAVFTTALALVVSMSAAYAFSRFPTRANRIGGVTAIAMRMFPPIIVSIPLYPILIFFGLENTHATLIVLYATLETTVLTWQMKAFLDAIPRELDEAAQLDGASQAQFFWRVIVPIARPVIATGAVMAGLYAWNEFQFGLLFLSGDARTAPVIIGGLTKSLTGVAWGQVFAASAVQFLPALVFLLLVQRALVKGVTAGAVKG